MLEPESYAFRTEDRSLLMLDSIGWQKIRTAGYHFDGIERPDSGHVIFQYTVGGQGWLEVEGRLHPLPKGSGFLVKVPSRHRYYYVEQDEPWEIVWLNLRGDEANRIWDIVLAQEGPVICREEGSPLIAGLRELLETMAEMKEADKYRLSARVYEWLLALLQTSRELGKEMSASASSMIEKAKRYMKEQHDQPLTLDIVAGHCGVNKHHFCRLFRKSEHTSPLAYLRDRRIEAAIRLLRTTELPVHEVGRRCGFDSPSYFGKVFRHYMSATPTEYRMKKLKFPYDAVYYERGSV